jgi:hypothetical protein
MVYLYTFNLKKINTFFRLKKVAAAVLKWHNKKKLLIFKVSVIIF